MTSLHGNTFWDWIREEPEHKPVELFLKCDKPVVRVHIIFIGQVQGVGFRYVLTEAAEIFGLSGEAMNLDDGSVEAFLQGSPYDIENAVGFSQLLSKYILIDDISFDFCDIVDDERGFITG